MPRSPVDALERCLLAIDRLSAFALYRQQQSQQSPYGFAETILTPALERIGMAWESGAVSLSQVYMAGRIGEELIEAVDQDAERRLPADSQGARVALAVLSDRHVLGKRMVGSALQAAGVALLDFGVVEPGPLVERTVAEPVDVLLISTLMLPSALRVKTVVEGLRSRGCRAKIGVGGAPFRLDSELWREVGADAMGKTASEAVHLVRTLRGGAA